MTVTVAAKVSGTSVHQSGDPSVAKEPPEFGWMALAGIAAEGVSQFDVRSSLDTDTGGVGADGVVLAVLRGRWREKLHVAVTLAAARQCPSIIQACGPSARADEPLPGEALSGRRQARR